MTFISAKAINRLNVKLNTFATYRSLNMYLDAFDKQFEEALNSLDSYSHWIDVGAGQARAQLQFLGMNLAISPKMTAIGITVPRLYYMSRASMSIKQFRILLNF